MAALELPGQGHRAGPDLEAVPPGLESDVDVQATIAGGLGIADDAELVQQGVDPGGRQSHLVERGARLGVEVDAQLVGVGRVVGPERPQVEARGIPG